MKISKKAKNILFVIIIISFCFSCWVGYFIYNYHYKIIWQYQNERSEQFNRIEDSFNNNPNISDAMALIDWYYNEKEDTSKALFFSNECIRLGVNKTPVGYLVNFWVADIYKSTGSETLARKHLREAIRLDKDKIILKNNWIDKAGLEHVLSAEEINSLIQN